MVKMWLWVGVIFLCQCVSNFSKYITESEILYWLLWLIEIAALILLWRTNVVEIRERADQEKKFSKKKYVLCILLVVVLAVAALLGWQWLMNQLAKSGYIVAVIAATAVLAFLPAGIAYLFERKKKAEKSE